MGNLLKFELFKLNKRKELLYMALSVIVFQFLMAIFIKYNQDFMSYEKGIQSSFLSPVLVNINIIFLACRMFAEDFEYLTIIPIKIKSPNVSKHILVKLLVVFLIHVVLLFLSTCFTVALALLLLRYELSPEILANLLIHSFSIIIPISIIILLVAIVVLVTKKEKTGLVLGMLIFMFYGFGMGVNFIIISKVPIFKYGIINLLNLPSQLLDSGYSNLTGLSSLNMLAVSFIYLIVEGVILYFLSKSIEA